MFLFPSLIIIFYDYQCQFFLFEIQFSNFRPMDNNCIMRMTVLTIFVSLYLALLDYFGVLRIFLYFLNVLLGTPKYFPQGWLSLYGRQFIEDKASSGLDVTWQKIRCDQWSVRAPPLQDVASLRQQCSTVIQILKEMGFYTVQQQCRGSLFQRSQESKKNTHCYNFVVLVAARLTHSYTFFVFHAHNIRLFFGWNHKVTAHFLDI